MESWRPANFRELPAPPPLNVELTSDAAKIHDQFRWIYELTVKLLKIEIAIYRPDEGPLRLNLKQQYQAELLRHYRPWLAAQLAQPDPSGGGPPSNSSSWSSGHSDPSVGEPPGDNPPPEQPLQDRSGPGRIPSGRPGDTPDGTPDDAPEVPVGNQNAEDVPQHQDILAPLKRCLIRLGTRVENFMYFIRLRTLLMTCLYIWLVYEFLIWLLYPFPAAPYVRSKWIASDALPLHMTSDWTTFRPYHKNAVVASEVKQRFQEQARSPQRCTHLGEVYIQSQWPRPNPIAMASGGNFFTNTYPAESRKHLPPDSRDGFYLKDVMYCPRYYKENHISMPLLEAQGLRMSGREHLEHNPNAIRPENDKGAHIGRSTNMHGTVSLNFWSHHAKDRSNFLSPNWFYHWYWRPLQWFFDPIWELTDKPKGLVAHFALPYGLIYMVTGAAGMFQGMEVRFPRLYWTTGLLSCLWLIWLWLRD